MIAAFWDQGLFRITHAEESKELSKKAASILLGTEFIQVFIW